MTWIRQNLPIQRSLKLWKIDGDEKRTSLGPHVEEIKLNEPTYDLLDSVGLRSSSWDSGWTSSVTSLIRTAIDGLPFLTRLTSAQEILSKLQATEDRMKTAFAKLTFGVLNVESANRPKYTM